ncbi:MAG: sugar transferase [Nitrospirae bacterium]|nr:sugar transferase [Nitrospirota bacterium]
MDGQGFLSHLIFLFLPKLIPGLTVWAQVNGRDDFPVPIKAEFDEYYLKRRSFLFDLKILFMTFLKVIRSEGVKH